MFVTGEVERAVEAQQTLKQLYPRNASGPGNLADLFQQMGQFDKAARKHGRRSRLILAGSPGSETWQQP